MVELTDKQLTAWFWGLLIAAPLLGLFYKAVYGETMIGILLFAVLSWSAFIMRAGRGRQGGRGLFFPDGQRRAGSWFIGGSAPLVAVLFAEENDDIRSGLVGSTAMEGSLDASPGILASLISTLT